MGFVNIAKHSAIPQTVLTHKSVASRSLKKEVDNIITLTQLFLVTGWKILMGVLRPLGSVRHLPTKNRPVFPFVCL